MSYDIQTSVNSFLTCFPKLIVLLYLYGQNCDTFLSAKFEELLKLMIEVLPSCHFSAKHHRLECLYSLIVHASKVNNNVVDIPF